MRHFLLLGNYGRVVGKGINCQVNCFTEWKIESTAYGGPEVKEFIEVRQHMDKGAGIC